MTRVEREHKFIDLNFIPNNHGVLVVAALPNIILLIKDGEVCNTINHTFSVRSSIALGDDSYSN
jgi:hypothetical protein